MGANRPDGNTEHSRREEQLAFLQIAIKREILTVLGRRPTAAHRQSIANVLQELAAEQVNVARILLDESRRPADQRIAPRSHRAGPGRTPATFVRVELYYAKQRERLMLYIGRGLYYAVGSPQRVDIARFDGCLELIATASGQYAVNAPKGSMPHFHADGARDVIGMEPGRYSATVSGNRIKIGSPLMASTKGIYKS